MAAKKRITFHYNNSSSPTWTAYQTVRNKVQSNTDYLLTEMSGWDEEVSVNIETADKLIGQGSYVISQTLSERELSFTVNKTFDTELDCRGFRQQLANLLYGFGKIRIQRHFEEGSTTRVESLEGYVTSINNFEQIGLNLTLTFTVLCPDPEINVIV